MSTEMRNDNITPIHFSLFYLSIFHIYGHASQQGINKDASLLFRGGGNKKRIQ